MAENENLNQMVEGVTEDVTDKKCPNCGATVTWDPATLAMTCDFCGYHKELPKPEEGSNASTEIDFNSLSFVRAKTGVHRRRQSYVRTAEVLLYTI